MTLEGRIPLCEQRTESFEGNRGAVDIGLEVPQVGPRPVLFLAGDLASRNLVKQATRPVGDLIGAESSLGTLVLRMAVFFTRSSAYATRSALLSGS
jgi:hypothetical protein